MGMQAQPIMNLEEMLNAVPEEVKGSDGCPSKDLHDDDAGFILEDGTMAFDDQSGPR